MENLNAFKVTVTAIAAVISSALGWFGWLWLAFLLCLVIDWVTGSAAAVKNGEWNSKKGHEGIWHKLGCFIVVLVAAILDIVIGMVVNNIPGIPIPFTYTVIFCPIALVWYILTETGSIIENAGKMGAPVPNFLKKAIQLFKGTVDAAGDKLINVVDDPPDKI